MSNVAHVPKYAYSIKAKLLRYCEEFEGATSSRAMKWDRVRPAAPLNGNKKKKLHRGHQIYREAQGTGLDLVPSSEMQAANGID